MTRKRSWQLRPFGKFSEPYSSGSDSSDFDYEPGERGKNEPKKSKAIGLNHHPNSTGPGMRSRTQDDNKKFDLHITFENPGTCNQWDNLPTEILIRVFSHVLMMSKNMACLPRFGRVCKQWNYASKHPSLWRKVDLSFVADSRKANERVLIHLLRKRGGDILELNLTGWSKLTDKGIMVVSEECPNLQAILLSKCMKRSGKKNISTESIIKLIDKCNLKKVDISWFPTDTCCNKIIRNLVDKRDAHLKTLNLCGCPVGSPTLQYIQASSPNLRILDLSNTRVLNINIEKIQIGCPALEELYLANLRLDFAKGTAKDQEASSGFPRLIALSIHTDHLTDDILLRLLKNACHLKLLDLRHCEGITNECLEKLPACSIEQLYLSRSRSIRSLASIFQKWNHSLVELDLSWLSPQLTGSCFDDFVLEHIAQNNQLMRRLTILDLSGTPVTDAGLRSLLYLCPHLKELNLTSCKALARGIKHKHNEASINDLRNNHIQP